MSRVSLRLRSVAAATLGILLAVVVVGAGVDVLVSRHLHRSFDHTLHERAVEVAQLAASAPAVLTAPGALDSPLGGTQLSVEVVDRRGRIVARSPAGSCRRSGCWSRRSRTVARATRASRPATRICAPTQRRSPRWVARLPEER